MATLLAATKPQVSARAHNRVLDAAQERVDRLEPRLAAVIEEILRRAGARAATLFHERATRHAVPDASLVAAGPDWSPPFADELIDVDALVKQILAKTEPVRAALIEQTMTPALEQAGLSFDVSNPLTAKLFADTGSQVTNIAMTTRANLMDIIGKSYQNGLTIPATRDLIRQGMRTASKTRATMIARCLPADALVDGAVVRAVTRRWYEGDMVVLITESGREFTATPNHPMLTHRGWRAAGEISEGDHLLRYSGREDPGTPGDEDPARPPATIAEIFDAAAAVGIIRRGRGGEPDFHGDGRDGEVDVATPDRPLRFGMFAVLHEHLSEEIFAPSDEPSGASFCSCCGCLLAVDKDSCFCGASGRDTRFGENSAYERVGEAEDLPGSADAMPAREQPDNRVDVGGVVAGRGSAAVREEVGASGLQSSYLESGFTHPPKDSALVDPEATGDFRRAQSGEVLTDRVVSQRRIKFAGYVFNLVTPNGYFTVNGGYTGNTEMARAVNGGSLTATQLVSQATGQNYDKVWHCVAPWTRISGEGVQAVVRKPYDGELVIVTTRSSAGLPGSSPSTREFTVTSDHLVLTGRGWIAAGLLQPGDDVVGRALGQQDGDAPDVDDIEATAEEIFDAAVSAGAVVGMMSLPVNLDDGSVGEKIDIPATDGRLVDRLHASLSQPLRELMLAISDVRLDELLRDGSLANSFSGHRTPTPSGVAEPSLRPQDGGVALMAEPVGVALASQRNGALDEDCPHEGFGETEPPSETLHRLSSSVGLDEIVQIERRPWTGHVYDLTTLSGWFLADGYVAHNTAPGARYPRHELYEDLDGQTVGMDETFNVGGDELQYPGDPNGEPGETINCVPGETVVQMGPLRAATRRWYEGDLVRVRLASGDELAATPNHPVLGSDGSWMPIGEVEEGDHLVSATLIGRDVRAPDPDRPPSPISEIHRLAEMLVDPERVRLAPPDFHGDGRDGEVDVVPIHGSLLIDNEAATDEQVREFGFALASAARAGACSGEMATLGDWWGAELTAAFATAGIVSGLRESAALVTAKTGHPQLVRSRAGSDNDAELLQAARDCWSADPNGLTDGKHAVSTVVSLAEVVQIDRYAFAGDVYNLDTGVGWYTAGSLVCGNCRCTLSYSEVPQAAGGLAGIGEGIVQGIGDEVAGVLPTIESDLKRLITDQTGEVKLPKVNVHVPKPDVVTADVKEAAKALGEGKRVELTQASEVNTLIDDLGRMAAEAQKAGEKAPNLDLGKVQVPGTNLFTQDSLGVPRVDMPQLAGVPIPGSPAEKLPTTIFEGKVSPWRDISEPFFQSLRDQGVKAEAERVNPETLRATQDELNGPKVAKLMDEMEAASPPANGTVFFEQNMTDTVKSLYAEQHLDTETLVKAANDAVTEDPMRLVHGNTGETGFFISDGKVFAWKDYNKMSALEKSHAVPVHSHSGVNYFRSAMPEPHEPWSQPDIHQWFTGLKKDRQGGRQMLLYADGKADIIGIGPTTDASVLKLGPKTLKKSLEEVGYRTGASPEENREAYHRWYEKHGLTYQEVQFAAPNDLVDLAAKDKYLDPEAKKARFTPAVTDEPVIISKDNYILDGHHRWAASLGRDYQTGVDVPHPISVERIDEPITTLLQQARDYSKQMGIPPNTAFDATKTVVTPPVPAAVPSVATDVQSIDIGITPFRAGIDNQVGFYDSAKYQQFVNDVNQSAQAYGVRIDSMDKVTGVWEGDTEPSVSIHVSPTEPEPGSEVYRGQHSAPGPDYGAPMNDLTGIYPDDVYDEKNQVHLYGQGGDAADRAMDQETFNTVNGVKGDPSAMVTVYRGVPGDVNEINPGDWVTPSKTYAEHHAEGNLGADAHGHVVSMQVPAGQLWTNADSIQEWGWNPPNFEDFNAEARARAFAANLGRAYNQDGVLLFAPQGGGESIMATFRSKFSQDHVDKAMKDAGISGGRFTTDGRLQVIGSGKDFVKQLGELSKELSAPEVTTVGEPQIEALTETFKGLPPYLSSATHLDQFESILGGTPDKIAEVFKQPLDAVHAEDIGKAKQRIFDATQASLKARDLPARFKVYRAAAPDFTTEDIPILDFHLTPQPGDTVAFEVERKDILADADVFFDPPTGTPLGRVLIRASRSNVTSVPMPDVTPGASATAGLAADGSYDIARGDFALMERDAGDYQKALDAFSHPKGVTAENIPKAAKPPTAKLARGDPITGYPTKDGPANDNLQADFLKLGSPQAKWVETVDADEDLTLGVDAHKINDSLSGVIAQYTQDGSHDINAYLAGHTLDDSNLEQYMNVQEVKNNAKVMQQIVDSAPPLPEGTTLYRGINPIGINPALRDEGNNAAADILDKLREDWGIADLDPYSDEYRKVFENPDFQKAHKKAVKQAYEAITKVIGNWAKQEYPVGSYVAMGEPAEFESMTLNPALAANFGENPGQPSVVFRVLNAKTGAPIFPFSSFQGESEILAPPDTMYRVRSVELAKMETANPDLGKSADKVVVTLEEAPKCGPVTAALTAATGVACTNIAQYVPKGDKPRPTVGNSVLFPGQDSAIAEDAAAHRDAAIAQYARDNNMSVADYKAAATESIRSYIAQHPQIRIRLSHQSLDQVVADGRFKNEFELPGVTPEMTDVRVKAEQSLFGIAPDADPASRPIYGYLAGTADETGEVQEYGDIIVNLDPTVNARATFTVGDSYRAGLNHELSPSLLTDPGIGSWDGSFDIVKAFREGDIGRISRYVEVEIHGGLPLSDVGGVQADKALIVAREDAIRVKESVEAITEIYANNKGTQQASPQVEQSGLPTDKPPQFDYATALREIGKNAGLRQSALADVIGRVGLHGVVAGDFEDFNILQAIGAGNI